MRRTAIAVAVVAAVFALAHFGIAHKAGHAWAVVVPDVVAAVLVSILFFAPDERPLVHEAHELPASARSLIQASVVASILAVLCAEEVVRAGEKPLDAAARALCALGFVPALFVPAFVETRARRCATRLRRDLVLFCVSFVVGALVYEFMTLEQAYVLKLLWTGSPLSALSAVEDTLRQQFANEASELLPLAGLAAAFVGCAGAGLVFMSISKRLIYIATLPDSVSLNMVSAWAPFGISVALGGAVADKLTRKIEARLPSSHSHAP